MENAIQLNAPFINLNFILNEASLRTKLNLVSNSILRRGFDNQTHSLHLLKIKCASNELQRRLLIQKTDLNAFKRNQKTNLANDFT